MMRYTRYVQHKRMIVSVLAGLVMAMSGCTQTETEVDGGFGSPGDAGPSDTGHSDADFDTGPSDTRHSDTGHSDTGSDTAPDIEPSDTDVPDSGSPEGDAGQDTDSGWIVETCPDHLEPNNTVAEATVVTAGQYVDLTMCQDTDYYELQLSPGDRFRVELEYETAAAAGEAQLSLFDDTGEYFLMGAQEETPSPGVTRLVLPDDGTTHYEVTSENTTFYILASRFSGVMIPYELTVEVQ